MLEEVENSVKLIDYYMSTNPNIRDLGQYKAIKIYQNWSKLSPFYLWSVPFIHDILPELSGNAGKNVLDKFGMIYKSKNLQFLIRNTVLEVESRYNIPPNVVIST